MAHQLRLCVDDTCVPVAVRPTTPGGRWHMPAADSPQRPPVLRGRLVAGRVDVPAIPREPGSELDERADILGHVGPARASDVISEIESTLERMQSKLNTVREQVDRVFLFPSQADDDRPRAA